MLDRCGQFIPGLSIHLDRIFYQFHVQRDASVIDFLILMVLIPHLLRDGIVPQSVLDFHFGFHVTDIVRFEDFPFLPVMGWQVAGASAIGFARRTGLTEIPYQFFSFRHFLLVQAQHRARSGQGQREAEIG